MYYYIYLYLCRFIRFLSSRQVLFDFYEYINKFCSIFLYIFPDKIGPNLKIKTLIHENKIQFYKQVI